MPMCNCVGCLPQSALHCQIARPEDAIPTPLPVDLQEVGHNMPIWPQPWWNGRLQGDEVVEEGPLLPHVQDLDGVSEPTPGPSTNNNVNGGGTILPGIHTLGLLELGQVSDPTPGSATSNVDGGPNLPSIHTLGLLELGQVSDHQNEPLDPFPSPATPISTLWLGTPPLATHPQVPSKSYQTYVPEQDSQDNSQDESSGDSSEMDSEDTQSGGSSRLSHDLGSGLRWRIYGPSDFAHESGGDSSESEMDSDTQSRGSSPLWPELDEHGSDWIWRNFGPSEFEEMYRRKCLLPLFLY